MRPTSPCPLSLLIVAMLMPWGAAFAAAEEAPPLTVASLVQGVVQREALMQDLSGYLLDRAWLTPWYAATRDTVQVRVATPVGGNAGGPPPPEEENRLYGAYLGEFTVAPSYARFDVAVLKRGEENPWQSGPSSHVTFGVGGALGAQPDLAEPVLPERIFLLRQDGRSQLHQMTGPMTMRMEITDPTPDLAVQQQPLADLLFGGARPTLAQSLQAAHQAAIAPAGGAARALPYEVGLEGPVERDGQQQYQLAWRSPAGNGWEEWRMWVCPDRGFAATELTQTGAPRPEEKLPVGTERVVRRWRFSDHRQLTDDLWLPGQVTFFEFLYSAATPGEHTPLARVHELTLYLLAANTNPEKLPAPQLTRGDHADALAALQAYFPGLVENPDLLPEVLARAESQEMPEAPEELLQAGPRATALP